MCCLVWRILKEFGVYHFSVWVTVVNVNTRLDPNDRFISLFLPWIVRQTNEFFAENSTIFKLYFMQKNEESRTSISSRKSSTCKWKNLMCTNDRLMKNILWLLHLRYKMDFPTYFQMINKTKFLQKNSRVLKKCVHRCDCKIDWNILFLPFEKKLTF